MTTLPADELVGRLNKRAAECSSASCHDDKDRFLNVVAKLTRSDGRLMVEAAAEISSLRAKLAEAMEVLEPIAECADEGNEDQPDDTKCEVKAGRSICYFLTLANFRAARRLIEGNGNG